MRRAVALMILVGFSGLCFAEDESQEPPLKYILELNGQAHELVLDKSVVLQGDYKNPRVVLRASAIRHFTYGNVSFEYPASFGWEAEIEGHNERTWTLSGNDFTIMYFILPEALSADSYVQGLAKRFGKGSTRLGDTEREFGGRRHIGKLLLVKLAGTTLRLEVYSLTAKAGSRLLVFQDSPPDDRTISKEAEEALAMLSSSFMDKASNQSDPAVVVQAGPRLLRSEEGGRRADAYRSRTWL